MPWYKSTKKQKNKSFSTKNPTKIILYFCTDPNPLSWYICSAFRFENESLRERTLKILSWEEKDGPKRKRGRFFKKWMLRKVKMESLRGESGRFKF